MSRPEPRNCNDPADVIETELAIMTRAQARALRTTPFRYLDQASYLLARTLLANGPLPMSQIAEILGLDRTTMTRQISKMETAELVTNHEDPKDGRVKVVVLCDSGREKLLADQTARVERVTRRLRSWTDQDKRHFGRLLARFNESLWDDNL